MNKPEGKKNQENNNQEPTPPLPVDPINSTEISKSDTKKAATTEATSRNNIYERRMACATVVIAFATIAYAAIAFYQLKVMSNTLTEMKNSGNEWTSQTSRLIAETNRIADAMTNSVQQSKKALDAAIVNAKLEQRAWVGVRRLVGPQYTEGDKSVYIKEGAPFAITIICANSGKTPAVNVKSSSRIGIIPAGVRPDFNKVESDAKKAFEAINGVLQPGEEGSLDPGSIAEPVSKEQIADINKGTSIIYVVGLIKYHDIFKRPHNTKFCRRLSTDRTTFTDCPGYNEAD